MKNVSLENPQYQIMAAIFDEIEAMPNKLTQEQAVELALNIVENIEKNTPLTQEEKEAFVVAMANQLNKGNDNSKMVADSLKEFMVEKEATFSDGFGMEPRNKKEAMKLELEGEKFNAIRAKKLLQIQDELSKARTASINKGNYLSEESADQIMQKIDEVNRDAALLKLEKKQAIETSRFNKDIYKSNIKSIKDKSKYEAVESEAKLRKDKLDKKGIIESIKESDKLERAESSIETRKNIRKIRGSAIKTLLAPVSLCTNVVGSTCKLVDTIASGIVKSVTKLTKKGFEAIDNQIARINKA